MAKVVLMLVCCALLVGSIGYLRSLERDTARLKAEAETRRKTQQQQLLSSVDPLLAPEPVRRMATDPTPPEAPAPAATSPATVRGGVHVPTVAEALPIPAEALVPEDNDPLGDDELFDPARKISDDVYRELTGRTRNDHLTLTRRPQTNLVVPVFPTAGRVHWRRHWRSDGPGGEVVLWADWRIEGTGQERRITFTALQGRRSDRPEAIAGAVEVAITNGLVSTDNVGDVALSYKLKRELGRIGKQILSLSAVLPSGSTAEGAAIEPDKRPLVLVVENPSRGLFLGSLDAGEAGYPREAGILDEVQIDLAADGAWHQITRIQAHRRGARNYGVIRMQLLPAPR